MSETKEDILYVIPRPVNNTFVTLDIDTNKKLEIILSQCFRTMKPNNICICVNKKTLSFNVDGYFKKDDDIYITLTLDNIINDSKNAYDISELFNNKPVATINTFDKNTLNVININGNWITNIYDTKTEFIFNFTANENIDVYKLFIEFELPYVDGIHSDIPINGVIESLFVDIKCNITQYIPPYETIEIYNIEN